LGACLSLTTRCAVLQTAEWPALLAAEPRAAGYLLALCEWPFPIAGALAAVAAARFCRIHGLSRNPKHIGNLGHYPFEAARTQLVIGEVHNQDGTPSSRPGWLVLPEKGLTTGVLVTGATGSGKTSAAHYPFTAQLIRLHADDPARRLGGLVI